METRRALVCKTCGEELVDSTPEENLLQAIFGPTCPKCSENLETCTQCGLPVEGGTSLNGEPCHSTCMELVLSKSKESDVRRA